jgi:hypothetical protein
MRKVSIGILLLVLHMSSVGMTIPFRVLDSECLDCEQIDISRAPRYRVARKLQQTTGGVFVSISIARQHFNAADLEVLACRLSRDFQEDVGVQIFDSHGAAKKYRDPWHPHGTGPDKHSAALRAFYNRSPAKSEHVILWYEGNAPEKRVNRVDLCACSTRRP